MKINKTLALLTVSAILGMAAANTACAQYGGYNGHDPMQSMIDSLGNPEAEMQKIMNTLSQQQDQLTRQMANNERQIIHDWRRATGDYSSSDQVVLARSMQHARATNPGAFEALDAGHRSRMDQINAFGRSATQISRTYSEIGDINHRGYMDRSRIQHEGHRNYVNNGIWEQNEYTNTNGNQVTLGWNQPGQIQTQGGNQYYTDGNHNQWQHTGNGLWEQLDR